MSLDTPALTAAPSARFSLRRMQTKKKLTAAFIFSAGVSVLAHAGPALGACLAAVLLLAASGLPARYIARRLLAVNVFFVFLWLLLPLSLGARGGEPPFLTLGPFAVYPSGFALALLITLKGNAIAGALTALTGSSTITENGHALRALRIPEKLVALLLLTHANLALMARDYQRLFQAALLRGFVPRTHPAAYKTYARLLGLLFLRSWQKAQRVEQAMRLRGFCGRFPLIPSRCACPLPTQRRTARISSLLLAFCSLLSVLLVFWDIHL